MKKIIFILICLLTNACLQTIYADKGNVSGRYIFNTITIENGLPLNFVDDIFKDSKGFIWIATQGGGLSRFDGYEFLKFDVNSVPVSLKSNFIKQTVEDRFNRLWVASDYGVDIIDLSTIQRSEIKCTDEARESFDLIMQSSTNSIYNDSQGYIWLVADSKIHRIDLNDEGIVIKVHNLEIDTFDKQYSFSTLCEINGDIWVGYKGEVYKVQENRSGDLLLHFLFKVLSGNSFRWHIEGFLKKENIVWIATSDGLYRYNLIDKSQKRYGYDPNNPSSLSQDMVTSLSLTNDGILVAGTLQGVNFYDALTDSFEKVIHTKTSVSLNSDFVNCMLSDGNNLWIGTEAGGIDKLTLRRLNIHNYVHDEKDIYSLAPNPVNAILEDQFGDLWVGNVEGGLNRRRKGSNKFTHYDTGPGKLSHKSVSVLEEDRNNKNLWVGTWGQGINVVDLQKMPNLSVRLIHDEPNIDLNYVSHIKYDSINNGMWIGTNRNIYFYDIKSGKISSPLPADMTKNIKGVLGMLIDVKGTIWIGTSTGIIVTDLHLSKPEESDCRARFFDLSEKVGNKLFQTNVTAIYQGQDKSIWIGSKGYGFCKLQEVDNDYVCSSYTTDHGLANNSIYGIIEDEEGLIWISTGNGISCYDPHTGRFANYTKNDGLIDSQFYWNASYKSPVTKNIYFGGINGLTELRNNSLYSDFKQHKVIFTKLRVLNKTVWAQDGRFLKNDISYTDCIELHESDKSFSLEFSALDYENPSTVLYAYRLLGFDDKWIEVQSDRRFASYTNLKPGTYTLQVKRMSNTHDWSKDISELTIIVKPFFYKTTWFIGLSICFLILLIVLLYNWRIRQFKKQREMLHLLVEERTVELEDQKKILEEQTVELKLQNSVLISQNEKISRQRKKLVDMSEKVQEAMSDKIAFFTNITHEFRTPITLITGPIDKALKLSTNPKVIEQLQFVSRNSKHLLSLVNQLMDFRKVESDNITISPITGDFLKYIDEVLLPFESFAGERNIEIRKMYRLQSPNFLFDEEAIRKVITNLLSNAIKFTPSNGIIRLYVCSFPATEDENERLYICVQDSGIGIKEEDLNKIFDRFYQSKNNINYSVYGQSGTGIGLYLSKKIVSLLDGKIEAKNNPTNGMSFRILLPLERENNIEFHESLSDTEQVENSENESLELEISGDRTVVLVVEDNMDMRKYISSILQDKYKILEAENGVEALEILKSKKVDFVVSDLMMPLMDGMELSKKVKSDFSISHIPFLMLTAKTSVEAQIDSYKIGVDEFLQKPFDEELLLARINNIITNRKLYQRKFNLYMNTEELNVAEESQDEKFLKKALEVVKKNYKDTRYETSDFIDAMGMSKSLVNKKMQILTGQSTGQFIRNYRLNLAHELILKKSKIMNISEIAYEVGFNDPKYFTRCFSKHFGIAPSALIKDEK